MSRHECIYLHGLQLHVHCCQVALGQVLGLKVSVLIESSTAQCRSSRRALVASMSRRVRPRSWNDRRRRCLSTSQLACCPQSGNAAHTHLVIRPSYTHIHTTGGHISHVTLSHALPLKVPPGPPLLHRGWRQAAHSSPKPCSHGGVSCDPGVHSARVGQVCHQPLVSSTAERPARQLHSGPSQTPRSQVRHIQHHGHGHSHGQVGRLSCQKVVQEPGLHHEARMARRRWATMLAREQRCSSKDTGRDMLGSIQVMRMVCRGWLPTSELRIARRRRAAMWARER